MSIEPNWDLYRTLSRRPRGGVAVGGGAQARADPADPGAACRPAGGGARPAAVRAHPARALADRGGRGDAAVCPGDGRDRRRAAAGGGGGPRRGGRHGADHGQRGVQRRAPATDPERDPGRASGAGAGAGGLEHRRGFAPPRRRYRGAHGRSGPGGAGGAADRRRGARAARPAGYLARRGTPETLEELFGFDVIGYDRETPALRAMLARCPGFSRAGFALRADSDLAQLAAIRAGFGIGVCQVGLATRSWCACCRRPSRSTCRSGW